MYEILNHKVDEIVKNKERFRILSHNRLAGTMVVAPAKGDTFFENSQLTMFYNLFTLQPLLVMERVLREEFNIAGETVLKMVESENKRLKEKGSLYVQINEEDDPYIDIIYVDNSISGNSN